MKIAFVLNFPPIDHRMVQARGVARALAQRGHEVTLILQRGPGIARERENEEVKVVDLGGTTYSILGQLIFMLQLLLFLKKSEFDVVHGRNPFSSVIPALFLKRLGSCEASLIYDVRGLWIDFALLSGRIDRLSYSLLLWLEKVVLHSVDRIIAISYELERILVERGVDPDRIIVVYGDGVDLDKFKSIERKGARSSIRRVGYVGSVSVHKKVDDLVRAFDQARPHLEAPAELTLIGPLDDDARPLTQLIARRGLEDSVNLMGQMTHEDALRHMVGFDVALSYDSEMAPPYVVAVHTKIFEYLAAGVPVVATHHPTHEVLLTDRHNGILVDATSEAVATAIQEVINDSTLAAELSRNGVESVRQHDMKEKAREIELVYLQAQDGG